MKLKIEEQSIAQVTPFGTAYVQDFHSISDLFHYSPYKEESYQARLQELTQRNFDRERLASVIRNFHSKWEITGEVEHHLQKLTKENSVTIIGGQQAGLLLGPLYTLHKVITIIHLAKQKEEELGVPVIPIFWIAGEDHDFHEINHVYMARKDEAFVDKLALDDPTSLARTSLSYRNLPKDEVYDWLDEFLNEHPETEFTEELSAILRKFVAKSDTYVDFFAQIMNHLFSQYGLLMIDSGDKDFREMQSGTFVQIIENYNQIDQQVRHEAEKVKNRDFEPQIQLGERPALLFIYESEQRLLLEKVNDTFQTKDGQKSYSKEDLLTIAREEPWRLSNNVITRPFMQDSLFPTLAFVGGPGEIAYWALYKSFFEHFNMKMPILAPRISMTFIENPIAKIIEKRKIPLEEVFSDFEAFRKNWLKQQDELDIENSFEEVKQSIKQAYAPLLEKVKAINPGMEQLGEKNITKILEQVEYLEKRSMSAYSSQHDAAFRQFDKVEQALYPHGKLQERVYNPFTYINKHGMTLISSLMKYPLPVDGKHKLIYLHA